jgi:transcriptional regulator with XRE-family HTH domain
MNLIIIKEVRKKINQKGYKQKFVAEKIGISSVQLSQYLSGKRAIPIEIVTKLKYFLSL